MLLDQVKTYNVNLAQGYRFSFFKKGDEDKWVDLEYSLGEFESKEEGLNYFNKEFKGDYGRLEKSCLFIKDDEDQVVATCTAWFGNHTGSPLPRIHWVGVHPEHQQKGLCKAIIAETLNLYKREGFDKVYLTTQTWSYKAINIYKQFGFRAYDNQQKGAFKGNSGSYECDFEQAWQIIDSRLDAYKNRKKEVLLRGQYIILRDTRAEDLNNYKKWLKVDQIVKVKEVLRNHLEIEYSDQHMGFIKAEVLNDVYRLYVDIQLANKDLEEDAIKTYIKYLKSQYVNVEIQY